MIARAVWRVIVRDGVSAVSLRTVAAEAGIVVGSLRHIFATKSELLAGSMELVYERAQERVRRHEDVADPRALVRAMLLELLPLDADRQVEMRVNLALVVESPAHPRLETLARDAQDTVARLCRNLCAHLSDAGFMHPSRDVDAEAGRMHVLIDGLALHLTVDPRGTPASARIVDEYLGELATPCGAA